MSYLGTVLDLPTGSGLTGVTLQPSAESISAQQGSISWHIVTLDDSVEAEIAGRAVSPFLPAMVAGLHGNQPDGSGWFAVFQFVDHAVDLEWAEQEASAAFFRALGLLGIADDNVWCSQLTDHELHRVFEAAGAAPVTDWDLPNLLIALILQLTNLDLGRLVDEANHPGLSGDALRQHRQEHLHQALATWSAPRQN